MLKSKHLDCIYLSFFKLSLGCLNIFSFPMQHLYHRIQDYLLFDLQNHPGNHKEKFLNVVKHQSKWQELHLLWCQLPKTTSLLNKARVKNSVWHRPNTHLVVSLEEWDMRTSSTRKSLHENYRRGNKENPSKMKAAHIFEETIEVTSAETLRWHQEGHCSVLIKVWFSELSSRAHYSGESGPVQAKSTGTKMHLQGHLNGCSVGLPQTAEKPIRFAPQHLHSSIQVKTRFLHEEAGCLPVQPSPGEHIWDGTLEGCMILTKARSN